MTRAEGREVQPPEPILVAHLLPRIDGLLVDLLRSLTPDEWEADTVAPGWTVRDVAAHLLDTPLRKLSICRDGYAAPAPAIGSAAELAAFVNRLNAEGITVYRRLSPGVLIGLIEWGSRESASFHQSLDPFADAVFPVSWAGETRSANWFDTAREYTERWHHQQQIRLAVGKPGIMTPGLYHPVLDCFMRALPHTYRSVPGEPGASVGFDILGAAGGRWSLVYSDDRWHLAVGASGREVARVQIPEEIAWRVFTKGIDRAAAAAQIIVSGDTATGLHILNALAIVA